MKYEKHRERLKSFLGYASETYKTDDILYRAKKARRKSEHIFNVADVIKSISMLVIASVMGYGFWRLGMSESNIIMIYILAVLITAVITTHQVYSLVSSIVSVFVFNFLFTEPRYTFLVYEKDYPVTFVTMFVAAFLTGSLAIRLKRQAAQAAQAHTVQKYYLTLTNCCRRQKKESRLLR